MKDGRLSHLGKNKLNADNKYKDSVNRKQYDIVLKNKAFKIAVYRKVNRYQRSLAAMV